MASRRQRRVSELIHRELSQLLMRDVRDPRISGVTITGVQITADLLLARIYYSVLGDAEAKKEARTGLESASGFLRTQLGARIRLRFVPELVFELDESAEYGRRIDELLDQIAATEVSGDEPEPA
jgi:ribosome-binding factor A